MAYVKNIFQFINEGLNKEQWLNYKNDTYLKGENPGTDELRIANLIMKLMKINDASKILFTTNNDSFDYDYASFMEEVVTKSKKIQSSGITFDDYTVYYDLYEYKSKIFCVVFVKDSANLSYIFISEDDYEFYNEFFGGDEPEKAQEDIGTNDGQPVQNDGTPGSQIE